MTDVIEYKDPTLLNSKLREKKFSMQFLPQYLIDVSNSRKISFKNQSLKSAYIIDIVHNLLLKYYFKKENNFNLSSVVLKEKYGHLYNYYIDYLVDRGVLILIKKHNKGKNARIYKMSKQIIEGDVTRYKNVDSILLKKYRKSIESVENKSFDFNPIRSEIKSKLIEDLFYVEIDYLKSLFFLDSSIQEHEIYQKNKYSIESIKDKHIFYHFDNYGRLHTNFTILKSFIRKNCLLLDGEETYEIDIKNSQPLFLNKLIENSNYNVDSHELEFYRLLTISGAFYKFLQDKLNLRDKKTVKDLTYKVFFGKNFKNKYDKAFESIFPSIYGFIKHFKSERKDYRSLSYELQRSESNFLFNNVISQILEIYPNIRLITCHDSIICKLSDKDSVIRIFDHLLDSEFKKLEKSKVDK